MADLVRLGPFQNIVNVGWGGKYLLVYVSFHTGNNSEPAGGALEFTKPNGGLIEISPSAQHDLPYAEITQFDMAAGFATFRHHFNFGLSDPFSDNVQAIGIANLSGLAGDFFNFDITTSDVPGLTNTDIHIKTSKKVIGKALVVGDHSIGFSGPASVDFLEAGFPGTGDQGTQSFRVNLSDLSLLKL